MVEVATMSKAEAMTTVDTMAKKYLDADAYNGAKNDGTAKALDLVAMLTSVLQTEYETVEKMAKKDRDQSEADRAGEHNAAGARFTGEKKRVECASLAVMQEAKTVMDADMKEADRLIDLDGNYDAALTKQSNGQGQAGPARPGSCKTLVDKVGGDDINYLEDERAAIKELKEILAGMDLGVKHKKTPDCKISYTKKANFAYPMVISKKWNYKSLALAQAKCTTLPNCVGVTKDNNGYNLRDVSHKGHYWKGVNSWQRVKSCLK